MNHVPKQTISITDNEGWMVTPRRDDGYSQTHPSATRCPFWVEDGRLEIETGTCSFITLEQTSTTDLKSNTPIRSTLLFDTQSAKEGTAYFHFTVNGDRVWQTEVPLPTGPGFQPIRFTLARDYPAGITLRLHFHNHGANMWRILPFVIDDTP